MVSAGARLDRLPMGGFHRRLLRLIALGMFFDTFDNAMMAGVLASLVAGGTSTMALNARYISVSFFGLTIGAALAGLMGDRWGRRFAYQFNLLLFGFMCLVTRLGTQLRKNSSAQTSRYSSRVFGNSAFSRSISAARRPSSGRTSDIGAVSMKFSK